MIMETSLAREILAKFKGARKVLLVMHRRPDPDSVGSAAAMAEFLDAQNIARRYFCATPLPSEAALFAIDPQTVLGSSPGPSLADCDVVCTFDAGDLKHVGLEMALQSAPHYIVNIDHHSTNTNFGDLNIVDLSAAATTEIIYGFFKAVGFTVTRRVAFCLLAGLLTDTDHFYNPATTASALEIASELIAKGVALPELRRVLFERRDPSALKLIGEALARLKTHPRFNIAVTYITEEDLNRYQVDFEDAEGLANILNTLGGARAMLLLKEAGGIIRGSWRTTRSDVDVGRIAEVCGGGGHRKAAGFTLRGTLQVEGVHVRVV